MEKDAVSIDRLRRVKNYLIEGIIPAHYPANVAQHFETAAADHGDSEADEAPGEGRLQDEAA